MSDCEVCGKYSGKSRFCSGGCGDQQLKNHPELMSDWEIGNCSICNKLIYSKSGTRKYCSPDCHREAVKLRNKNGREPIPQYIRTEIFKKYNYKCVYCGSEADCIDHVHPVSKGGRTVETNLVTACTACNIVALDNAFKTIEEKRTYILRKRNINPDEKEPEETFVRPAWHAWVYGGQKRDQPS